MKNADMVIGKAYFFLKEGKDLYYYVRPSTRLHMGVFIDTERVTHELYYTDVTELTETPTAKPAFNDIGVELGTKIEVCDFAHFKIHTKKGEFKHLNPDGTYWIVDDKGYMRSGAFARKVEPMVVIWLSENEFSSPTTAHKIRKSLADKIITGEA